jgi:hypothetical protein
MPDLEQYAELSRLTTDELLVRLGDALGPDAFPRDPLQRGRDAYEALRRSLQDYICGDPALRSLCEQNSRVVDLAAALADLLSVKYGRVPAAAFSTLLVRDGLDAYCRCRWR